MRAGGAGEDEIRRAVVMLDSQGLVFEGRDHVDDDKRPFALPGRELARFGFEPATRYELETVVRQGALYPPIADLRQICQAIAAAVAHEAHDSGVALRAPEDDLDAAVRAAMWAPGYQELSNLDDEQE